MTTFSGAPYTRRITMSLPRCTVSKAFLKSMKVMTHDMFLSLTPSSIRLQGKDLPSCGSVWTKAILRVSQTQHRVNIKTHSEVAHQYGAFKIFLLMTPGEMGQYSHLPTFSIVYCKGLTKRWTSPFTGPSSNNSKVAHARSSVSPTTSLLFSNLLFIG